MKILAIRGKNLASLEGEFEVDFTAEPLCSAGIFAITGSTGSGKSTLLDALCLALFDETPRNNRTTENISVIDVKDKTINQKDSRNILRRGTADGYAEVDFVSLGGEQFRSRWSVRRSRDKVDGSLQNSEFRLANLSTDSEVQGRKTELLAKVVELIGLTFDQFTRAVLLAQGDFATFLKATQKEKAELLEKLTGTDIYSRISASIYEKSKSSEQDLALLNERIKDIELLSDEDLATITTENQTIATEVELLKTHITELTAKIKWIADTQLLSDGITQAQQAKNLAEKAIEDAKPRYEYLALFDSVQEIRDSFTELTTKQKQLEQSKAALIKQQTDRDANALLLTQSSENAESAQKELQKHNDEFAAVEPLIRQARTLDTQIAGAKTNVEQSRKEFEAAQQSQAVLETSIAQKQQKLTAQKETLGNLEAQQIELQSIVPTEVIALREKLEQGQPCSVCGSTTHPYKEVASDTAHIDMKEVARRWRDNLERHAAAKQAIANLVGELSASAESLTTAKENVAQKQEKLNKDIAIQDELQKSRALLLDGKSADEFEQSLTTKRKELIYALQQIVDVKTTLISKSENYAGTITQISSEISTLTERCAELQSIVDRWLDRKGGELTTEKLSLLLTKGNDWITTERESLNRLHQNKTTAIATLNERNTNLEKHNLSPAKPTEQENSELLTELLKEKSNLNEQKTKRQTEIDILLANHIKGKEKLKAFEKELDEKSTLSENWKKLNEMFGSADGAKFKVLAQGYTLDALLTYANKHLQELSKRYELQRIGDTLALQVVDLDMLGEVRTVHSLSGGESFLVSLSLALGLSSLSSSRMKVESLFIDEGFGSLDIDTLRVAMDALESLQTQGRKIGVISHVAEMTERITTQIRVIKTANGRSKIEIA